MVSTQIRALKYYLYLCWQLNPTLCIVAKILKDFIFSTKQSHCQEASLFSLFVKGIRFLVISFNQTEEGVVEQGNLLSSSCKIQ